MTAAPPDAAFDQKLALSVVPSLLELAKQATLHQPTSPTDPEARQAKLTLSKQATLAKQALATLRAQAESLPADNLSLDDQHWIVEQLEQQLKARKAELAELAKRVPVNDSPQPMET